MKFAKCPKFCHVKIYRMFQNTVTSVAAKRTRVKNQLLNTMYSDTCVGPSSGMLINTVGYKTQRTDSNGVQSVNSTVTKGDSDHGATPGQSPILVFMFTAYLLKLILTRSKTLGFFNMYPYY